MKHGNPVTVLKPSRSVFAQPCKLTTCTRVSDWKGYCSNHKGYHFSGFICKVYSSMRARVLGQDHQSKKYPKLWLDKELLSREEFYNWAISCEELRILYMEWVISGYQYKFVPTIDRINSDLGYSISNIRWVTFSDNAKNVKKSISTRKCKILGCNKKHQAKDYCILHYEKYRRPIVRRKYKEKAK